MDASDELQAARVALRRGQKQQARRHALQAAALNPYSEEPWIVLAACDSPAAALRHLQRALAINPNNQTAQKGLEWFLSHRSQTIHPSLAETQPIPTSKRSSRPSSKRRPNFISLTSILLVFLVCILIIALPLPIWILFSSISPAAAQFSFQNNFSPSETPTETSTQTPTSTATQLPSSTPTPFPTETPIPTATATFTPQPTASETPTVIPSPTAKSKKKKKKQTTTQNKQPSPPNGGYASFLPKGVGENDPWIEVDLSSQTSHAYIGKTWIRSFIVSTGTWQHPTVTGVYRIYVKYRSANMSGPDYFLPNVPYVMYFYKGYGLHGTYWHQNFGFPMSHGCVNYTITDAAWLFDFASVGTVVYIHE
jgi:lipoprotein-anchoring transpeptidase ErfK/SrfK